MVCGLLKKYSPPIGGKYEAEQFRPYVQPDTNLNDAGQWTRKARSTRLRLLVSYLRAWASVLINIFSSVEKSKDLKVHHTINTIITDDTNMRLSTETPDVKEWKSSRIVSVMNCVQALIISFGPSGHEAPRDCKILPVHTPLVALPRADRDSLCSELISRLFLFMGQVSERFQAFKVAKDIAARVPISAIALCFDSLVTNLAVLKVIRGALFEQLKKDRELDLPNDYADGPGNDDEAWHAKLMELVNSQQEITPAQVNAKRKQLTFAAFRDPQIAAKTTAVEALIAPNVHKMHKLFQRSAAVASIQRSRSIFLDFVLGKFGHDLIDDYLKTLNDFKKLTIPSVGTSSRGRSLQVFSWIPWRHKVKEVSNQWSHLDDSEKDRYQAQAAMEQALRESAASNPLPSKSPAPASSSSMGTTAADCLGRNARKAVSRQRAMATYTQYKTAADWQEHDGGICSADGAIQLDLIDVDGTEEDILCDWQKFAKPAGPLPPEWKDIDDGKLHHSICHTDLGKLSHGSLIQFQDDGLADQFFFLGSIMKKPRLHILMQGHLQTTFVDGMEQQHVCILEPSSLKPAFQTSHQVFQKALSKVNGDSASPSVETITFTIHSYTVNPFQPLHTVCLNLAKASHGHKFVAKKAPPAKQAKLPFGLAFSPRKRAAKPSRPRPAASAEPAAKKLKKVTKAQYEQVMEIEHELQQGAAPSTSHNVCDDCDDSSSSSSLSTGSSGDHSDESESGEDTDANTVSDNDSLPEEPFLEPAVQEEEQRVESIIASHDDLMMSRGHCVSEKATDVQESQSEAEPGPPAPTQPHLAKGSGRGRGSASTFCNAQVGLIKVETQVAARLATCRGCGFKISRGSVRWGYSYSKSKFEDYVHADCIEKYLNDKNANLDQVRRFIHTVKQQEQLPKVREAISQLESRLG
ncbi:Uncharacterized protein SCF082_LOCUS18618 [Durusdinium trenchii]|uniref:PARP-type domain-containing protein n=1 Tax=Durusdinium trenchii TaxID=1381693 RepID=A0ABP0KRG7_9DINO